MLVGDRMSKPVISAHTDLPIQDALVLMRKESIRRLPVVDANGHLKGVVSERDLLHAAPSDATSLSVWELNYLLSKITVDEVMTQEVITTTEDTPLEEAALLMADNKIGGLPVIREGEVVGIITETDLFKVFLELLGARDSGVRVSTIVKNQPGELAKVTSAIHKAGGNIVALGTFLGESTQNATVVVKVEGIEPGKLTELLEPDVIRIADVREMKPA
jgi:acetoin utilization protein AcuB